MAVRLKTGHTHALARHTDVDLGHRHLVLTISGRPLVLEDGHHVHRIRSLTTFVRQHAHAVSHYTGSAILISGSGMHYHRISAVTTTNKAHHHELVGRTRRAPNIPASVIRAAQARM